MPATQGKSSSTLMKTVLFMAFFLVLGYFLLIAVQVAAPDNINDENRIAKTIEHGKEVILGFFGLIGAVIGYFSALGQRIPEIPVGPEREKHLAAMQARLAKVSQEALKAKQSLVLVEANGLRYYSFRVAFYATLAFGVTYLLTGGFQGLLHKAYSPKQFLNDDGTIASWHFYPLAYAQTELLVVFSLLIPSWFYCRFLRYTRRYEHSLSTGHANRIGSLSLFAVGLLSLITLSPEQIATLLTNKDVVSLPGLNINYFLYLALTRVLLFPVIGLIACHFIRCRKISRA